MCVCVCERVCVRERVFVSVCVCVCVCVKSMEKRIPHVAQIKEPARYVRTQVGVTAGTDMMFNDPKLAIKAIHH